MEGKATAILQEHGVNSPLLAELFKGDDWTMLVVDEGGELTARVVPGICNYGALPGGVTVHHFHTKTDKPQLDHDGDGKAGGSLPVKRKPVRK